MSVNETNISGEHPERFRGATHISMGKSRRISLPQKYRLELPYRLVEVTPDIGSTVGQWLMLCDSRSRIPAPEPHLHVLSEYGTYRPTLSRSICEKYLLDSGDIRLVGQGSYLEIWSETDWLEKMAEAFRVPFAI